MRSPVVSLTKEEKRKLAWIDHYHKHKNARKTCRYFGIHHKTFYRYLNRFNEKGLVGLKVRSKRPGNVRRPLTPLAHIDLIKKLRTENPEYSKYKLAVILSRDYDIALSASTVGRVIKKYHLFFASPVKPKGHPDRVVRRRRKPKDFVVEKMLDLIEVDVKHLPMLGTKRYGFVAIDVVGKRVTVHVASTISSNQAAIAWRKTVSQWGLPEAALSDNGSENLGAFAKLLNEQNVDHYFARPHTPKDKPVVERFIGTLERECIQWGGLATDLADQQEIIDIWLEKYHNYRPHQALGYLTPNEYLEKLKGREVAPML